MDNAILNAALLGLGGGLARSLFSLGKTLLARRPIIWKSYAIFVVMNAAGGSFLGAVLSFNPTVSLLAGYASFDLLDSAQKLLKLGTVKVPIKMATTRNAGIPAKARKSTWDEVFDLGN